MQNTVDGWFCRNVNTLLRTKPAIKLTVFCVVIFPQIKIFDQRWSKPDLTVYLDQDMVFRRKTSKAVDVNFNLFVKEAVCAHFKLITLSIVSMYTCHVKVWQK